MIQPHPLAKIYLLLLFFWGENLLNLGKFGWIGKIWAKVIRFEQILLDLGKIKILHPQTHSIFYGYGQV